MDTLPTHRIVTNSDLDALVSAVLLKRVEPVGAVKFLPHERIKDGTFQATNEDIVVNMPFLDGCRLWFDHHSSNDVPDQFDGLYDGDAPSAARVVYRYYVHKGLKDEFDGLEKLLKETDKVDDARFEPEDIRHPEKAVLVSFLIDSHPIQRESISENLLMISLLDSGNPDHVLEHPVFEPRKNRFLEHREQSKQALAEHLTIEDGLVVNDFRQREGTLQELTNDKFLPFVVFENSHTLLRIKYLNEERIKLNLGFNMFRDNDECPLHYGKLLKQYGGGGHERAAGCSVPIGQADEAIEEIKQAIHQGQIPGHPKHKEIT